MRTHVKDFIEISDHTSLDGLIAALTAIRDSLPEGAEPELKMRGDDVFGRRFSISYLRQLTAEEIACDARYAHPADSEIERLRRELDAVELERRRAA